MYKVMNLGRGPQHQTVGSYHLQVWGDSARLAEGHGTSLKASVITALGSTP